MTAPNSNSGRRRRLPRPSWLLLAYIVCLLLGVGGYDTLCHRHRVAVVRFVENRHGVLEFDHTTQRPFDRLADWFPDQISRVAFYDITKFELWDKDVTDDDMAFLMRDRAQTARIRLLSLSDTRISDATLANLQHLHALEDLSLSDTRVTGSGLRFLSNPALITRLNLHGTPLTDEGLQYVGEMVHLKLLAISATDVTAAGITELSELRELDDLYVRDMKLEGAGLQSVHLRSAVHGDVKNPSWVHLDAAENVTPKLMRNIGRMSGPFALNLEDANISDDGLAGLAGSTSVVEIRLDQNPITDDGLRHLAALPELQRLWIHNISITDAGLTHLAAAHGLQELHIFRCNVTAEGCAEFRRQRPDVRLNALLELVGRGSGVQNSLLFRAAP